jgi:hypothetical protein
VIDADLADLAKHPEVTHQPCLNPGERGGDPDRRRAIAKPAQPRGKSRGLVNLDHV